MKKLRPYNLIAVICLVAFSAALGYSSESISQSAFTKSHYLKIVISGCLNIQSVHVNHRNNDLPF